MRPLSKAAERFLRNLMDKQIVKSLQDRGLVNHEMEVTDAGRLYLRRIDQRRTRDTMYYDD